MESKNRVGYSPACCGVSAARAACRALVRRRPVSVVHLGQNGPRVFVTCTREEPGLCQYVRRSADGTILRATAVRGDAPGVDLAIGEGILTENGVPAISPEVLSAILAGMAEESRGQSVRVVLSADTENLTLLEFPEYALRPKEKKTLVVLLGETDADTLAAFQSRYGADAVKPAGVFRGVVAELAKSAALNVLFAGKLGEVARFLGIQPREATHLLGGFEKGRSGVLFASSPQLLEQARNQETLELLQALSEEHAKTGILITQA